MMLLVRAICKFCTDKEDNTVCDTNTRTSVAMDFGVINHMGVKLIGPRNVEGARRQQQHTAVSHAQSSTTVHVPSKKLGEFRVPVKLQSTILRTTSLTITLAGHFCDSFSKLLACTNGKPFAFVYFTWHLDPGSRLLLGLEPLMSIR
jgi:hypothetical protein